jgi:hypothetical protein
MLQQVRIQIAIFLLRNVPRFWSWEEAQKKRGSIDVSLEVWKCAGLYVSDWVTKRANTDTCKNIRHQLLEWDITIRPAINTNYIWPHSLLVSQANQVGPSITRSTTLLVLWTLHYWSNTYEYGHRGEGRQLFRVQWAVRYVTLMGDFILLIVMYFDT